MFFKIIIYLKEESNKKIYQSKTVKDSEKMPQGNVQRTDEYLLGVQFARLIFLIQIFRLGSSNGNL